MTRLQHFYAGRVGDNPRQCNPVDLRWCRQAEGGPQVRLESVPHQSFPHNQPLSSSSLHFQFGPVHARAVALRRRATPSSVRTFWKVTGEDQLRPGCNKIDECVSYTWTFFAFSVAACSRHGEDTFCALPVQTRTREVKRDRSEFCLESESELKTIPLTVCRGV